MDKKERVEDWSEILLPISLIVGMILLSIFSHISLNRKTSDLPHLSDEFPYYDETGMLTTELTEKIHELNDKYKYYGVQLGVVFLNSLRGRDLYYTTELIYSRSKLFSGAGQIIIVSIEDEAYTMKNFGELDKVIDKYEMRAIDEKIFPYFLEQKYSEGIIKVIDDIERKFFKYSKYVEKKELEEIKSRTGYPYPYPAIPNPNR